MQRTDSIFFISGHFKSELAQPNTGNSQGNLRNIFVYRFNTLAETKQMQASIKKSGWIIDRLNIYWCAVLLSSFTRFCFAGFFCTCSLQFIKRNRDFDP